MSAKPSISQSSKPLKLVEQGDTSTTVVERFKQLYQTLNKETLTLELLNALYDEEIRFEDSLHRIDGLENMFEYFENLYANVNQISFDFHDEALNDDLAFLSWTMRYQHTLINRGHAVEVSGASKLTIKDGLVVRHRDYFDAGQMLYEHLPGLRMVIRKLKSRLA